MYSAGNGETGGRAGDEFHLACVIIDETDQLRPYYRERPLVRSSVPRHWEEACCASNTEAARLRQFRLFEPHSFGSFRSLHDDMVC